MTESLSLIPADSFHWLRWRRCDVRAMFGCVCRESNLINKKHTLRKYAIGYHPSERLACRPKKGCVAVMFLKDDIFSWFHLTNREFSLIFITEVKNQIN